MDRARFRRLLSIAITLALLCGPQRVFGASGQPGFNAIISDAVTRDHVIALTFDDGPSPYTWAILSLLRAHHASATFFVVGMHVVTYPKIVKAEVTAGDLLGNHTYTHVDLAWLPEDEAIAQLQATQRVVRAETGTTPLWFRPPFDAVDARVVTLAARLGLRTVTWSVDPRDWSEPGVAAIVQRVLVSVRPGSIVLFHDGGGYRAQTVAAVSVLLPILKQRGYRFVTLNTLFPSSLPHQQRQLRKGRGPAHSHLTAYPPRHQAVYEVRVPTHVPTAVGVGTDLQKSAD
ncbi:MAG: polysaccharide deacetylase family protein [Chloroflexota bacterium]